MYRMKHSYEYVGDEFHEGHCFEVYRCNDCGKEELVEVPDYYSTGL